MGGVKGLVGVQFDVNVAHDVYTIAVTLKNVNTFLCFFLPRVASSSQFFKYRTTRRPRSSRLACSKALEKTENSEGTTGAEMASAGIAKRNQFAISWVT